MRVKKPSLSLSENPNLSCCVRLLPLLRLERMIGRERTTMNAKRDFDEEERQEEEDKVLDIELLFHWSRMNTTHRTTTTTMPSARGCEFRKYYDRLSSSRHHPVNGGGRRPKDAPPSTSSSSSSSSSSLAVLKAPFFQRVARSRGGKSVAVEVHHEDSVEERDWRRWKPRKPAPVK